MIDDIAMSNRTDHQLEQIADRLDKENFENSLNETLRELVVDLGCFTRLDLMDYPNIFENGEQLILAKLLQLASRIGMSRKQLLSLFHEFARVGDPKNRLEEIETEFESFLQSPSDNAVPLSLLKKTGASANCPEGEGLQPGSFRYGFG